jgi:hypothetical protein
MPPLLSSHHTSPKEKIIMFQTHLIRTFMLIMATLGLLGLTGKSVAAPTPVAPGIYCIALGHQRLECHADVSGGTGVYTNYQWTPIPLPGGNGTDLVIVRCAQAMTNQTVYLTVTDSAGAQGSDQTTTFCGDAE